MNKIIIMGNMTRDPELRHSKKENLPVCTVTIAVPQSNKPASFFDVVCWRELAEFMAQYGAKGRKLLVEGRLQNRTVGGEGNSRRVITQIVADHCEFCDDKRKNADPAPADPEPVDPEPVEPAAE